MLNVWACILCLYQNIYVLTEGRYSKEIINAKYSNKILHQPKRILLDSSELSYRIDKCKTETVHVVVPFLHIFLYFSKEKNIKMHKN